MANKLKKRHDDILDKRNEHFEKINQIWKLPLDRNINKIILEREVSATSSVRYMYEKNSITQITKEMSRGCNFVTQTFIYGKVDKYVYPEDVSDLMIDKNI